MFEVVVASMDCPWERRISAMYVFPFGIEGSGREGGSRKGSDGSEKGFSFVFLGVGDGSTKGSGFVMLPKLSPRLPKVLVPRGRDVLLSSA